MKNIILLISFVALSLVSCKKDNSRPQDNPKGTPVVRFKVTPFTQQITDFETSAKANGLKSQSLGDNIKLLYIVIYNNNGTPVRTVKQNSTDNGFGEFEAELATGSYTAVFAGGQSGLTYKATSLNADVLQYIKNSKASPFEDTFFKKIPFTITNNTQQDISVELKRIVGKLTLNLQATVPTGALVVSWYFEDKAAYSIANEAPLNTTLNSGGDFNVRPGDTVLTKSLFVLGVGQPTMHRLTCYRYALDETEPHINYAEKRIVLESEVNKHITVSGSLFGNTSGNTGIGVDVNANWDANTNTYTF